MVGKSLWEEFNLAENNPDQGGGILYCLRYKDGRIAAHRDQIVSALKEYVNLEEAGPGIDVLSKKELDVSERRKVMYLLEELSVLNEAQEYHDIGFGCFNDLEDLKNGLISYYVSLIEKRDLVGAYNLVDMTIPQIVRDIKIADKQNGILDYRQRRVLEDLESFSKNHVNLHNKPGRFVIMGINGN